MNINDLTNQSQKDFFKYSDYINKRYPEAKPIFKAERLILLIKRIN